MSKPLSKAQLASDFAAPPKPLSPRSTLPPEGHQRLTINLSHALHRKLRQAALDRNSSATEIIVSLLQENLP